MTTMRCVIYKSERRRDTYLYVPGEDEVAGVPEGLLQLLGRLDRVMELELTEARRLAQADAGEVMRALSEQGFYLQMPRDVESTGT